MIALDAKHSLIGSCATATSVVHVWEHRHHCYCGSATPEWTHLRHSSPLLHCRSKRYFVSRIRNKFRFVPAARRAKIRIVPCADRPWLKQSPQHRAHLSRVPGRQDTAIRLMVLAAQPEVGLCSSVRRKAHELAPLIFSVLVETKGHWPSTCSFSHSRLQAFQPRAHHDRHSGCQKLRDLPKLSRCDAPGRHRPSHPLIHSLNEFVRRLGHERQQIYLIPLLLSQSRFMALADSD